eukprot:COSAG04_NODE_1510_length_6492_cov_11.980291_2_plen_131_part_00
MRHTYTSTMHGLRGLAIRGRGIERAPRGRARVAAAVKVRALVPPALPRAPEAEGVPVVGQESERAPLVQPQPEPADAKSALRLHVTDRDYSRHSECWPACGEPRRRGRAPAAGPEPELKCVWTLRIHRGT